MDCTVRIERVGQYSGTVQFDRYNMAVKGDQDNVGSTI
jgi:hypothetical protein